jgi:hypothetical protein
MDDPDVYKRQWLVAQEDSTLWHSGLATSVERSDSKGFIDEMIEEALLINYRREGLSDILIDDKMDLP